MTGSMLLINGLHKSAYKHGGSADAATYPATRRRSTGTVACVRDPEVRSSLISTLSRKFANRPHVLVPEVDVRWTVPARLDALLVADRICGFEIKSDVDSLSRLTTQVEAYNAVSERACLVVGRRHIEKATKLVPSWWAVWRADAVENGVPRLRTVRAGTLNPAITPLAVTTFLPRAALVQALTARGRRGLSNMSVDELRTLFVAIYGETQSVAVSRQLLRGRADWQERCLSAA